MMRPIDACHALQIPSWFQAVDGVGNSIAAIGRALRGFHGFLSHMYTPTPTGNKAIGATNFIDSFCGVFAIPNIFLSIYKACCTHSLIKRIQYVASAVVSTGTVASVITSTINGLRAVGVIAQNALPWAHIVSQALYPIQFVSLALDLYSLHRTSSLRSKVIAPLTLNKKLPIEKRIENLTSACTHVLKEKHFSKILGFSKEAAIKARVEAIRNSLLTSECSRALDEGESLMKMLKGRLQTKFVLHVAAVVVSVVSIILTGVLLFTAPPLAIIGVAIAVGSASGIIGFTEKLLLDDNPFRAPPDVWYEKITYQLRQCANAVLDKVKKIYKIVQQEVSCQRLCPSGVL